MKPYKILAVNPGSTSTKIALFEDDSIVYSTNVSHDAKVLETFKEVNDQLEYRKEIILQCLASQGHSLEGTDAFVGRGGGTVEVTGGTYTVNDIMVDHARTGVRGFHPSSLGPQLAMIFAREFGGKSYIVNSPTTDEFQDVARITGFAGVYRQCITHTLNQKEVAIRYAASIGKKYAELNLVVVHIGGGVSVTAHRQGVMVDCCDILNGDGPMAPTRAGALPAVAFMKLCYSGRYTQKELYNRITKSGGLVDHLGTSDAIEVERRIDEGDAYAKLVYDAMIYQIGKNIGAYATVLEGKVDAILLTGGISNSKYVTGGIEAMVKYIAPIHVMAGEFEMEALAAGALRVLRGEEEAMEYSGDPVWTEAAFAKLRK